jgi:hypothetical protein
MIVVLECSYWKREHYSAWGDDFQTMAQNYFVTVQRGSCSKLGSELPVAVDGSTAVQLLVA